MKSGKSYGNTLRKLVTAISKIEPRFDRAQQLESLAARCCGLDKATGVWEYEIKNFSFPSKTFKEAKLDKVHPQQVKDFKVILSVEASGSYLLNEDDTKDPIEHLAVNVVVTDLPGNVPESIFCAWHLDSHPPKGATGNTFSPFVHPRYHWQYGGEKVWNAQTTKEDKEAFYGSHLLLESPRLPHPPLDVVLAIDFVLANYYSAAWKTVRLDPEYKRVVIDAQNQYWRSYYTALLANWSPAKGSTYSIDLMPFFYPK